VYEPGALTATQELYRQFWSLFEPLAKQRGWTSAAAPAANWWSLPTGVTGATWTVSYAMFGCRSDLYFEHPDPAVNLARWQLFHDRKDEVVAAFGGELNFDELPNKGCRIEARLNGPKISDRQRWPEVVNWMGDTQTPPSTCDIRRRRHTHGDDDRDDRARRQHRNVIPPEPPAMAGSRRDRGVKAPRGPRGTRAGKCVTPFRSADCG
jgi:hypothetical protein